MRKKLLFFQLAYYVLCPLAYGAFFYCITRMFHTTNLGEAIAVTYGLMFLATPMVIVVLMRFSLLKWYVDPFAAVEVPLLIYIGCVVSQMNRSGIPFFQALLEYNEKLSADGGEGWCFLIGLFLFGLVASLSFARKSGESISYKLISKIVPQDCIQHDEGGCES